MATRRRRKPRARTGPARAVRPPADLLHVEVTIAPAAGRLSVVKSAERPSRENVERFRAEPERLERAARALGGLGFRVTSRSRLSLSARVPRDRYARVFGTTLAVFRQPLRPSGRSPVREVYFPPPGAKWSLPKGLAGLVDDAYIQWPPLPFESPLPPRVPYHHLRVPGDVTLLLGADRVHREGTTGKGVRVAMVDSGFHTAHPYFVERGYRLSVVLAPGATDKARDGNGHGTAECANLLAVAPDVDFVGIKLDDESDPGGGASLAEGFKTAVAQDPDVISVSLGFDLADPVTRAHRASLPNSLRPLEAEVEAAVASGIVVVFSAGNGHVAFPGMMPDVLSAGGTYVDEALDRIASDYASAFESRIYPARRVPDVTGLVGLLETEAAYILLPLAAGSAIDRDVASPVDPWGAPRFADATAPDDGWAAISGTSAAAPQLAGVCALLKQKNPSLTPAEIKSVLARTARDVVKGHANPASNEGNPVPAGPGPDGATGSGLVDAFAAWKQV